MKQLSLKSTCDDSYFSSSEIEIEHIPSDNLNGVALILHRQMGSPDWVYLRKGEVKDLIDNLTKMYERLT